MSPLLRQFNWIIAISLSFILIFTGSTLAATNDRQLPSVPHPSSLILHPSTDGAKIYKQWCSTCHGDRGQGLTEEFRATWPEGKQNCWQAKCHAGSHPPDGFSFPKVVPALIGPEALAKFSTAQDLYIYSRAAMPYWSPNLLSDEEYLAITAFLVEANLAERNLAPPATWPDDLTTVPLRPVAEVAEPLINKPEEAVLSISWLPVLIFSGISLISLALGAWLRHRFVRG